ncbi:MAG: N-acetylglutaminylglutamine synthetase [Thiolinea sp.]
MTTPDEKTGETLDINGMASLKHWGEPPSTMAGKLEDQVVFDCGWGRLIFGQTFRSNTQIADLLRSEAPGQRDVALYVRDPQIVISKAPQELFIDPSLTFRLDLSREQDAKCPPGVTVRPLKVGCDAFHVNRIYKARGMVPLREDFLEQYYQQPHPALHILVVVDDSNHQVLGCVTGVDHFRVFNDPDNGSSLWALAVDPQCPHAGIGRILVQALARCFKEAGRGFMDLSVMHDNEQAIQLYRSFGFAQVPVYCIKARNAINERLYTGRKAEPEFNIYARIIIDEAYRRGIDVTVRDAANGFFDLSLGGKRVSCRESLSDFTSAVAMSRCADKAVTRRFLAEAGVKVPAQSLLADQQAALDFLQTHQRIVIKPACGEQGNGVFVDLKDAESVKTAYQAAKQLDERVIGENYVAGDDLRIIVINNEVVAAAVRKPAEVIGDGRLSVLQLIEYCSRRRAAATDGESSIPLDDETRRCVADAGMTLDSVLSAGEVLQVRKTANLHTGGTIHDVTEILHPVLERAAVTAARALDMPLVGLDFIVADVEKPEYAVIEANERPGLANHEPQPTAERFIDMLFPQTAARQRT